MSDGEVRKVSLQDIQMVQNLIERCLQLYMSQREVVSTLFHQAKIEPGFTELVWQKLEAENQEFFGAYHLRLMVKDQILRFNQLLERQVDLMCQMSQSRVVSTPLSSGSQTHSMHNYSAYQDPESTAPSIKSENIHPMITAIPNVYSNGTSLQQQCMQVAVSMAGHTGRVDVPANMLLAQSSNAGIVQGFNRGTIKTDGGYAGDSLVRFSAENILLEPRNVNSGGESCSQTFNETMLEPEMNSLGQITGNFSLSDLTADFSNGTDIPESHSRSSFLGIDANFLDPHTRGEEQDIRALDIISEGFSYGGFGSE